MNKCSAKEKKPFVGSDADLESNSYSLQKFMVYETQTRFYLVGRDKAGSRYRVLKIDRSEPSELHVYEDPAIYTKQSCNELLMRLVEGNRKWGGVNFVTKAYGIVGFVKFLEPYYMILITKRRLLGKICGHAIYGVGDTLLLTVPHPSVSSSTARLKAESRYKRLFMSIDLTKDFFFSYTYRIMRCLQSNVKASTQDRMPYDDMFVWNSYLTQEVRGELKNSRWTIALVHGFFKQVKLTYDSSEFILTLIARRSRHYAGTRYLKRGVNEKGRVANDVETEQIVYHEKSKALSQITSITQHRGSIPLYWSQETSVFSFKPDIVLQTDKDPTHEATRLHFSSLASRYGNPIIVLNLVKTVEKKPRETILCHKFAKSVSDLNRVLPKLDRIKFIQWDLHMFARRKYSNVLEVLESIAVDAIDLTGFYYSGDIEAKSDIIINEPALDSSMRADRYRQMQEAEPAGLAQTVNQESFQQGVLRSNCIDCLDRTNVAQYALGLVALGRQMHALGLSSTSRIGSKSGLAISLMDLYETMGDVLAIQYGGSSAHNKVFSQKQGKWYATIRSMEFFRSIRRHYNNAYLDGEKQDAINIFLGHFRPEIGKLDLWQLDSDNHLQVRRCADGSPIDFRPVKRSLSAGNMFEQDGSTGILRDSLSMASSFTMKPKPFFTTTMARRVATISEAEMRGGFEEGDNGGAKNFRQEGECPHAVDFRSLGDSADIDNYSSSGNSCEEDAQERHFVNIIDGDSCQSSGYLPSTSGSETFEDNEYFQDLTNMILANGTLWLRKNDGKQHSFEEADICHTLQEVDMGSGKIRIRAGAPSINAFAQGFVDWIENGQTLCY